MEKIKTVCCVETKFLGPTNTLRARVKGSFEGFTAMVVSWNHELDTVENHFLAAQKVIDRFNADRKANDLKLERLAVATQTGYVFPIAD